MNRRRLLCGTALLLGASAAGATPPRRIVALEWSIVSMLLSLGVAPVGMPEIGAYAQWVGEPAPPPGTADIGIKTEPNLEAVAALRPELILASPLNRVIAPLLATIAPVREVAIYTEAATPLLCATEELRRLGTALDRAPEAEREIANADAAFAAARHALDGRRDRPVVMVSFLDAQHVRVFGRGSLFGDVLTRLGLANGWDRPVNLWGFALVGIAELAAFAEARLVVVAPTPPGLTERLGHASLWSSLPAVRAKRVAATPAAWQYGDLTAARRFASFLPPALGSAA